MRKSTNGLRKRLFVFLFAAVLLALFAGCAGTISYKMGGTKVTVKEIERSVGADSAVWVNAADYDVLSRCSLVVKGAVSDIREVELTYGNEELTYTSYMTLFDLKIEEVYRGDTGLAGQTLTFGVWTLAKGLPEEVSLPEEDGSCIVFGKPLTGEDDTLGFKSHGVADCYAEYPNSLLIPCENPSSEKIARVFEVLSSKANASAADANFVLEGKAYTLSDLEAYLRAKCK